ncbi:hypothetical protein SOVF_075170 [Spinacia oleracea]|nr:hypothetical protein SOVF_075170 [Spinacia oleracea]
MARAISMNSFALAVGAVLSIVAAVNAQVMAPTSAPAPDAGAGFFLPISTVVVASSLLFSIFSLLKH